MQIGAYSLTIFVSYLIGSLPTGYLAGMARGIDIRAAGSGNIGATNVFRVLGNAAGIAVLAVDGVKGFAAARWVPLLAGNCFPGTPAENLALAAGAAAVLGHVYTCWLKFKGGKGIATSAGVGFAWAPEACAVTLAIWGIVFALHPVCFGGFDCGRSGSAAGGVGLSLRDKNDFGDDGAGGAGHI